MGLTNAQKQRNYRDRQRTELERIRKIWGDRELTDDEIEYLRNCLIAFRTVNKNGGPS